LGLDDFFDCDTLCKSALNFVPVAFGESEAATVLLNVVEGVRGEFLETNQELLLVSFFRIAILDTLPQSLAGDSFWFVQCEQGVLDDFDVGELHEREFEFKF
jgi:hypothetical protein